MQMVNLDVLLLFTIIIDEYCMPVVHQFNFSKLSAKKTCDFNWILNDYWHFISDVSCQCEKFAQRYKRKWNEIKWNTTSI